MANERAYALLREYKSSVPVRDYLSQWGAHSIGIGKKVVDGEETDRLALRIYVSKKRTEGQLSPAEQVPETIRFLPLKGKRRTRIYTDVIESPAARFETVDPETRIRPVPGGVSGGISGSTGTVGGWVWDTTDDTIVMLSNAHVFGHTSGTDILQQGTADGGSLPADKIGDVKRGIARSTTLTNIVDCAIGEPDNSGIYDLSVLEIGPAVYAIEVSADDMLVEKYGQTTRHTFGKITDNDWEGWINDIYYFEDCFRVDAREPSDDWSAGGDSGSLVFHRELLEGTDIKPVVGLHFAGSSTHGIECKIQNVFNRLDLTTLCDGSFAAISESLFETETEGEEAESRLETLAALASRTAEHFSPLTFVRRERRKYRARRFHSGIARDIQKQLKTSRRGQVITDFIDEHRAELLKMFLKDGDVRRSTLAAFKPMLAGSVTTSDVLERKITSQDLERLERLGRELKRGGSPKFQESLKNLEDLRPQAEGDSIAELLKIER